MVVLGLSRRKQKFKKKTFQTLQKIGTLRYPGRGGKGNGESLEPGRRHLRGKNKLRLSRLGEAARLTREDKVMLSCFNSMTSFRKTREVLLD